MNWDIIQGKWKQLKGNVKEKWGELTDDEIDQIDGNKDQLAGKLQEKYGWAKNDAEREIDDYFRDKG
ncbi:CsbD family protein [Paracoccus sp. (in: a-proteobacteria)]|uniref:CsbD family protein n=1 Tax=Paracoccus sp. TaxID=267 RepID=UPI0026E03EEB|nr:CsbD family protein [Paracoccus sp. (in: a-proteobacteria)]MDO5646886.1 CsbD family protein [Paracoccus sp. (in: a-proteobacteria)]